MSRMTNSRSQRSSSSRSSATGSASESSSVARPSENRLTAISARSADRLRRVLEPDQLGEVRERPDLDLDQPVEEIRPIRRSLRPPARRARSTAASRARSQVWPRAPLGALSPLGLVAADPRDRLRERLEHPLPQPPGRFVISPNRSLSSAASRSAPRRIRVAWPGRCAAPPRARRRAPSASPTARRPPRPRDASSARSHRSSPSRSTTRSLSRVATRSSSSIRASRDASSARAPGSRRPEASASAIRLGDRGIHLESRL